MLEQARPHVRNNAGRELRVPAFVPDRDDRGEDAGSRQHAEDRIERLKILLAERVVDQEFQAQRHDDVEQGFDDNADADERQHFLVVLQERLDECIDRRQRAGGFLCGKDDEILIVLVVFNIQFVVALVLIGRRRCRCLAIGDLTGSFHVSARRELLLEFWRSRIIRGSGSRIIR